MRAKYPKFLVSKPLVLGMRMDDLYKISFFTLFGTLVGVPNLVQVGVISSYVLIVGQVRRTIQRDFAHFLTASMKKDEWHLIVKRTNKSDL